MSFDSCMTMLILERLSAIPHVASTLFTVILAFQRFICVSKPFTAGNYMYITVKSSLICILRFVALSVTLHVCRFIDKPFEPIGMIHQNTTINTCKAVYATWVKDPFHMKERNRMDKNLPCTVYVINFDGHIRFVYDYFNAKSDNACIEYAKRGFENVYRAPPAEFIRGRCCVYCLHCGDGFRLVSFFHRLGDHDREQNLLVLIS